MTQTGARRDWRGLDAIKRDIATETGDSGGDHESEYDMNPSHRVIETDNCPVAIVATGADEYAPG
jgi:hypothetical protein